MPLRLWYNHPGTRNCFWNTPFGTGCIWGAATDADTIALRNGGIINPPSNFGSVFWVSQSASDPTATFSGSGVDYDGPRNTNGVGTQVSVTAHVPAGAYTPGPQPGDNQLCFADVTGHPGQYSHFSGLDIPNFQAGQGPFSAHEGIANDATTDLFASDY